MSILTANVAYLTSAPVAGGGNILAFGGSSCLEWSYLGTVTFQSDGSNTAPVINFIDGTNALPFTPSAVQIVRYGGNAANSIVGYVANCTNAIANVVLSAAPSNNLTLTYIVLVLK